MTAKKSHHNRKVARNRNDNWRKSIVAGKLKSQMNPTPLKQARVKSGFSQIRMAVMIGCSFTTYGEIERGKRPVRRERGREICKALSVRTSKVFEDHGEKKYIALR